VKTLFFEHVYFLYNLKKTESHVLRCCSSLFIKIDLAVLFLYFDSFSRTVAGDCSCNRPVKGLLHLSSPFKYKVMIF
jgi:hypothetical protein